MSTQADVEAAARRLVKLLDAVGTKDQDHYGTLDEAFRDLKLAIYTLQGPNYWVNHATGQRYPMPFGGDDGCRCRD